MKKKRNIKEFFVKILKMIYFLITGLIPIMVFAYVFFLEGAFLYALAVAYLAFIGMDIICCTVEYFIGKAYNKIRKIRLAKKKEKENEMKQFENLLKEKNNYNKEIENARKTNKEFRKKLEKSEDYIPTKKMFKSLIGICDKMDNILNTLNKYPNEFYPIRHTFKIYYPEFIRMTYKFIEIEKGENLESDNIEEFRTLILEISEYLNFAESQINSSDKLSLNFEIKALVTNLETERKRVEK